MGVDPIPLGPFDLHRPIGHGGMCEVWRGVHRQSQLAVAVKVILQRHVRTSAYVRTFGDEVRAVAGLHHQNIVVVFDYGQLPESASRSSEGRLRSHSPYMVMELANGSLSPYCGKLNWPQVRWLLFSLLDALAHAHARRVIHRDIKPGNLLLIREDGHSRIKLADFGLAHVLERSKFAKSKRKATGTPAYMAPELFQVRWRDYGPWTDLYALGCTAYALLTGTPPFGRFQEFEVIREAHLFKDPPSLDAGLGVPKAVEYWLRRLLRKDPNERFQRASDAAWSLHKICRGKQRALFPGAGLKGPHEESTHSEELAELEFSQHPLKALQTLIDLDASPMSMSLYSQSTGRPGEFWVEEPPTKAMDTPLTFSELLPPDAPPKYSCPPPLPRDWREKHPRVERPAHELHNVGLGLFGLRSIPLVGREAERDAMWSLLKGAALQKRSHALLLEGRAGCGKSRLAQWFCEYAHEVGAATILRASHGPLNGPADGLLAMWARYFRTTGLSHAQIHKRLGQRLPREGLLQPGLWHALTEWLDQSHERSTHSGAAKERHQLLLEMLKGLSLERPVVVWLDDVQWGLETLEFVELLLQKQGQQGGILLLLTIQQEALPQCAIEEKLLEQLSQLDEVHSCPLGPLGPVEHKQLLQHLLGMEAELLDEICEKTQGNPLFAIQMLGDWVQRGRLVPGFEGFRLKEKEVELPADIHQMWRGRLERLLLHRPASDGEALELAAALGHEVQVQEWQAACEVAGLEAPLGLVELLVEQRLASSAEDGISAQWSFGHGMLRDALEQRAREQGRWKQRHAACAEILRQDIQWGAQARHGRHLLLAGRPQDALAPLLQAIREYTQAGDLRQATALLGEWEGILSEYLPQQDHPYWGELWLLQCQLARAQNDYQSAGTWAARAIKEARRHQWETTLIQALIEHGLWSWRTNQDSHKAAQSFAEAHDLAQAHRERAEGRLARRLLATGLRFRGALMCWKGQWDEGTPFLLEAHGLFAGLRDLTGMGQCMIDLAEAARQSGQLPQAKEYAQKAFQHLSSYGNRRGVAGSLNVLGDITRLQGALDEAEHYYRSSLSVYKAMGGAASAVSTLNIGVVLLERGEFEEAYGILQQLVPTFASGGLTGAVGFTHALLLPCAAHMAQWSAFDHHLQQAKELLLDTGSVDIDIARAAAMAGQKAQEAGEIPRSRLAFELSLELWQAIGDQPRVAELQRQLSQLPRLPR